MFKKLLSITIIILLLLTLSGCENGSANTNNSDNIMLQVDKLEEVVIVVPLPDLSKELAAYAEELIRSKGFNIRFVVYAKKSGYFDYTSYLRFCENVCSENKNVVIVFKSSNEISGYLLDNSPGLVKDIKKVFNENAPSYYQKYQLSDNRKIYDIPLGIRDNKTPRQLAVLVRNKYAEEYVRPIKTADDYARFLEWAATSAKPSGGSSGSRVIPGFMPVGIHEKAYYNSYVPFDLFAQQYGYITASTVLPLEIGGIYTRLNPDEDPGLLALENIPEFRKAIIDLCSWAERGWMEFGFEKSMPDKDRMDKYASIVVNTMDYITKDTEFFFANDKFTIDANDYTMYMLYPDGTPNPWSNITEYDYCAVVSAGSEHPESFFRFLEWLTGSQENYDFFHYGVLNTDYVLDGNKIKPMVENKNNTDIAYASSNIFDCFSLSDYSRISPLAPSNWEEVRGTGTNISLPILNTFSQKQQKAIDLNSKYIKTSDFSKISSREKAYIDFFYRILTTRPNDAGKLVDEFILERKEAGDGEYLAKCFFNMYKELAKK